MHPSHRPLLRQQTRWHSSGGSRGHRAWPGSGSAGPIRKHARRSNGRRRFTKHWVRSVARWQVGAKRRGRNFHSCALTRELLCENLVRELQGMWYNRTFARMAHRPRSTSASQGILRQRQNVGCTCHSQARPFSPADCKGQRPQQQKPGAPGYTHALQTGCRVASSEQAIRRTARRRHGLPRSRGLFPQNAAVATGAWSCPVEVEERERLPEPCIPWKQPRDCAEQQDYANNGADRLSFI